MNPASCPLTDKHCVSCEGGTPKMTPEEVVKLLLEVPEWISPDNLSIMRDFKFKDFAAAMAFVNSVAKIAEDEGHHPDIYLHNWNNVKITLSTHAIGGLSENDFILAAKINQSFTTAS